MNIVHIVPGSGGNFYCQNCIRDLNWIKALRAQGHDVTILPMYLPFFVDEDQPSGEQTQMGPVFYGALSAYLEQSTPLFKHMPRVFHRLLDARPMLRLVSLFTSATSAYGLEEMTISVLRGENGQQAKELEQLVSWLKSSELRPDVIHISNALLLGLAGRIREELAIPVVCTLQDEHTWINGMREAYRDTCWQLLREKSRDIAAFIAVSDYYARFMQDKLNLSEDSIHVVKPAVDCQEYLPASEKPDPPVLGFLSPLSTEFGLDTLAEAFILLKRVPQLQRLKLKATGGRSPDTKRLLKRLHKRFNQEGVLDDIHFLPDFTQPERIKFLQSLSILSVPAQHPEAFGLYQIEAMAAGVPVVQPDVGSYSEIISDTGGGRTYSPNNAETLAENLKQLLCDPDKLKELGDKGRASVEQHFSLNEMAENMLTVYSVVQSR